MGAYGGSLCPKRHTNKLLVLPHHGLSLGTPPPTLTLDRPTSLTRRRLAVVRAKVPVCRTEFAAPASFSHHLSHTTSLLFVFFFHRNTNIARPVRSWLLYRKLIGRSAELPYRINGKFIIVLFVWTDSACTVRLVSIHLVDPPSFDLVKLAALFTARPSVRKPKAYHRSTPAVHSPQPRIT